MSPQREVPTAYWQAIVTHNLVVLQYSCRSDRAERQCTGKQMRIPPFPLPPLKCRVVADVWEKDVWDFQAKSGSSGSCRLLPDFLGKIAVQEMSGKTPGTPRHPSSRRPRPSENVPDTMKCERITQLISRKIFRESARVVKVEVTILFKIITFLVRKPLNHVTVIAKNS